MMFTWDEKAHKKASGGSESRSQMYRRELKDRAELLRRLGHSATFTRMRLFDNIAWEFELHNRPTHAGEVDRVVDEVYGKMSLTSRG
jgi:hypothetical protein